MLQTYWTVPGIPLDGIKGAAQKFISSGTPSTSHTRAHTRACIYFIKCYQLKKLMKMVYISFLPVLGVLSISSLFLPPPSVSITSGTIRPNQKHALIPRKVRYVHQPPHRNLPEPPLRLHQFICNFSCQQGVLILCATFDSCLSV